MLGADNPDVTERDSRLALVIDDSRAMRGILTRILVPLGFEVREAGNGREALDLLWNEDLSPELACVDWNMPVMNGLDFVIAVRKQKHLRQVIDDSRASTSSPTWGSPARISLSAPRHFFTVIAVFIGRIG